MGVFVFEHLQKMGRQHAGKQSQYRLGETERGSTRGKIQNNTWKGDFIDDQRVKTCVKKESTQCVQNSGRVFKFSLSLSYPRPNQYISQYIVKTHIVCLKSQQQFISSRPCKSALRNI